VGFCVFFKLKIGVLKMIERIWLTKGDNLTDDYGGKADRMLILKISGNIYFSDFYGTKDEAITYLENFSHFFRVATTIKGAILWGVADKWVEYVEFIHRVTLCNTHHDELLSKPLFMDAVRKADGKLWHSVDELQEILK